MYSDKDTAGHCNEEFLSIASASGYIWLHAIFNVVLSVLLVLAEA
jgi:hypothetical protein